MSSLYVAITLFPIYIQQHNNNNIATYTHHTIPVSGQSKINVHIQNNCHPIFTGRLQPHSLTIGSVTFFPSERVNVTVSPLVARQTAHTGDPLTIHLPVRLLCKDEDLTQVEVKVTILLSTPAVPW